MDHIDWLYSLLRMIDLDEKEIENLKLRLTIMGFCFVSSFTDLINGLLLLLIGSILN